MVTVVLVAPNNQESRFISDLIEGCSEQQVFIIESGSHLLRELRARKPRLILLDGSYIDVAKDVLATTDLSAIPVVLLIEQGHPQPNRENLRVDHIPKPCFGAVSSFLSIFREFIRTISRMDRLEVDGVIFSVQSATLEKREGSQVALTPNEVRLLYRFMCQPDSVLSKADLSKEVWNDKSVDDRQLRQLIKQLREKMDEIGDSRERISNNRAVGYSFKGTLTQISQKPR